MSAEVGCPGIIDTGASKSVIGQRRVKRLIESLPKAVQDRVQWGKSETVFRFGNNGVLSSVGALYLPIGDRWMRLEVVNGETPFLLSNAFLKSTAADVSSGNGELIFRELGCRVPLKTNPKGLFTVELSEVLQVFSKTSQKDWNVKSCEVVTFASDHMECRQKQNHTSTAAATTEQSVENSAAETAHTRDLRSVSLCSSKRSHGEHEGQPIDEWQSGNGGASSIPRGCRAELCKSKPSSNSSTSGNPDDGTVGRSALSRREASEQELPRGVQPGPQVPGIHDESPEPHKCVGFEFPELCPGDEHGQQSDANHSGFQSNGGSNVGSFVQGNDNTMEARYRKPGVGTHGRPPRAFSTTKEEPQPRDLGERRHDSGQRCREGTGHHDQDCHLATGARFDEETNRQVEISCSVTPAPVTIETDENMSTPKDVGDCHRELERLSVLIQKELDVMLALSWEVTAQRDKSPSKTFQNNNQKCKLDLLEIYCEEGSNLTEMALKMGLRAKRFTRKDGDLSTAQGQAKLWDILLQECPRDVWMSPECKFWGNFSRLNMCRSQGAHDRILQGRQAEQTHLSLRSEVYDYQVVNGRHFHMEQPQGSEVFEQKRLENVVNGTLRAVFDMCEVGKLKVPQGNNFLRKRSIVRTTSRELHETLDSRYCSKRHNHQPIEGSIRYLGRRINLSEYAARYSNGFAKNVCWYLLRSKVSGEIPLELAELCIEPSVSQEQLILAGELKAQKCATHRRPLQGSEASRENPRKKPRKEVLAGVFVRVEKRAPRVGTVVVGPEELLFEDAKNLCSTFQVVGVEICRGTDRFRLPKGNYPETEVPIRQTFILHRQTGEVEQVGNPEKWLELPRTRRTVKSKPAKLCMTVFGKPFPTQVSKTPMMVSEKHVPEVEEPVRVDMAKRASETPAESDAKRHRPGETLETCEKPQKGGEYEEGFPPKGVAKHGPRFLDLSKEEREWLRRVHHRMGHPDPNKLARFLKDTHADPHLIAGALEFQCDACSETQQGYRLARPSAIHTNLGFNEVVGLDKAVWTNSQGTVFSFFHVLDEGTLFHLGRLCGDDADSQVRCFDELWLSWAGPPKTVYLDPAAEYVGSHWLNKMQSEDIELKMTATDSHWQLGRVESHGHVIKRMLDRMNAESPILDAEGFIQALRQAFTAKNTMARIHGYTPEQAVLGIARRLPASVVSGESAASHLLAADEGSSSDHFRRALELRCSARKAFVEADNCSSLRRALLRRSRPLRDPYEIGDWVLYWKKVGGNMRRERGKWFGPARIAMVEGTKVLWLSHANKLIRASPEQVRPASFREWKEVQKTEEAKHPVGDWLKKAQYQDYFDLGEEVPGFSDVVEGSEQVQETSSIPEPEQAPSVSSESGNDSAALDANSRLSPSNAPEGQSVDPLTAPIPEANPGELSDANFGDTVEVLGNDGFWEIDITPENWSGMEVWDSHKQNCSGDEVVYLASEMRKKRVEVKLKELGEHDQRLFAAAKHKEIGAWLHHKTVRRVVGKKIPEHALMRCRWILNWKSATGSESPAELSSTGERAKARLVIIGFEDPGIDSVTNDAPTLTKDGRMAVLQTVASNRWELVSFDVSTAFLHGKGDGRELGIHPPPELREALEIGEQDQCALDGGAYGRIDAPYLWFCEFRDELIKQGCTQCPLDPCVFGLYSKGKDGKTICHGTLGIHVDDGIAGGDQVFMEMLRRIEKRFKFGSFERKEFKYTG